MTPDLATLIEQIEKLNGPDRELDGEIEAAFGAPSFTRHDLADGWHWEFEADDRAGVVSAFAVLGNKAARRQKRYNAPLYTASSDAALTLLPDGAEYEISTIYGMARVSCPLNGDVPVTVVRKDGNVILAAAECFLRARLELSKGGVRS